MNIDMNVCGPAVSYILLSIAFWRILVRLGEKDSWRALIPGLRYYAVGSAIHMHEEAKLCLILELVRFAAFLGALIPVERVHLLFDLFNLVIAVLMMIYSFRIFLQLRRMTGRSRWLIPVWFLFRGISMLIVSFSRTMTRPEELDELLEEEWKAGVSPAELAAAGRQKAAANGEKTDGLFVDIRERTVSDMGTKRYLLKDIVLQIPRGSMVLLLGGSGSGKTTLVNAVTGYEQADADVILNGVDLYENYDQMKYRVGFVTQQNLIRGNDTVLRTIMDAAEMRLPANTSYEERRKRVDEVCDILGLSAGVHGLVGKKSGGMLRRISIAVELISDPELLILDEPDSGLDGVIARELFEKLRSIADQGRIVIAITHTPDRVIELFDKVIVLARDSGRVGRLAFYGTPAEARRFFGKETMEGVVMTVNRKEEGGEGRADEMIAAFAASEAGEAEEGEKHE